MVYDIQPPVFTNFPCNVSTPLDPVTLTGNNTWDLDTGNFFWPTVQAHDNVDGSSLTWLTAAQRTLGGPFLTATNGDPFKIGPTQIRVSAVDNAQAYPEFSHSGPNAIECFFFVRIVDIQPPTVTCPSAPTTFIASDSGYALATLPQAEVSDNNGAISANAITYSGPRGM